MARYPAFDSSAVHGLEPWYTRPQLSFTHQARRPAHRRAPRIDQKASPSQVTLRQGGIGCPDMGARMGAERSARMGLAGSGAVVCGTRMPRDLREPVLPYGVGVWWTLLWSRMSRGQVPLSPFYHRHPYRCCTSWLEPGRGGSK